MKTFTFEAESLSNYSFHICDIELASEIETIAVLVEEGVNGLPEIIDIEFLDEDENEISYKEADLPSKALDDLYEALYKAIDDEVAMDKEEFDAYQAGY